MTNNTILVTGGAGFIGSHLSERMVSAGHHIVCMDNFNDYYLPYTKRNNIAKLGNNDRFKLIVGDVRDPLTLKKVFDEFDIGLVIHLAAMAGVRPSIINPQLYFDVNVNGTVNVLQECHAHGIDKFIFASSSSVYGNNSVPFKESDRTDNPISPYAASKKAGELACFAHHAMYSMSVLCLRFFTVFGPRQRPDLAIHKFAELITQGKAIELYGDGRTSRDYTFIDDIVGGIVNAAEYLFARDSVFEIINLGNAHPTSLKRLVQIMEKTFGRTALVNWIPPQLGDVEKTYADVTKAHNLLAFSPKTSIEEGMVVFKKWFDSSGGV